MTTSPRRVVTWAERSPSPIHQPGSLTSPQTRSMGASIRISRSIRSTLSPAPTWCALSLASPTRYQPVHILGVMRQMQPAGTPAHRRLLQSCVGVTDVVIMPRRSRRDRVAASLTLGSLAPWRAHVSVGPGDTGFAASTAARRPSRPPLRPRRGGRPAPAVCDRGGHGCGVRAVPPVDAVVRPGLDPCRRRLLPAGVKPAPALRRGRCRGPCCRDAGEHATALGCARDLGGHWSGGARFRSQPGAARSAGHPRRDHAGGSS